MRAARSLLARHLRQRLDLGDDELFLDGLSAADARALVASADPPPGNPRPATATQAPREGGEEIATEQIVRIGSLHELETLSAGCPRCRLAEGRRHVVFGEGNPNASVVVVGEAPGGEEDRTGRPFVGPAGRLLDRILLSAGFGRDDVYICNVIKCRPPKNRNPRPDEIEACSPYLRTQIRLLEPRAILACGTFAAQTLLGSTTSIGRLRGQVHEYLGVPLLPTYHPAALLRNPGWGRPVWEDVQRLRALVEGR